MNSFHKLATKNDFSAYLTQINCHFFFLQHDGLCLPKKIMQIRLRVD